VSLCDQELLMAKQLGERFGVAKRFSAGDFIKTWE